jgi:hypothetical protein
VVGVQSNLNALDLTVSAEFIVEGRIGDSVGVLILWELVENILFVDLVLVLSSERIVEWKTSDGETVDVEVLHLILSSIVAIVEWDNSRIEWFEKVSVDLWFLCGNLDSVGLEDFGQFH